MTCLSFLGFIVMGAYGNMAAIDAFLVGTSAATVTGLATFGSSPVSPATRSTDAFSEESR